jgi:hypothetical protein
MALPTQPVTCRFYDQSGNPAEGARVVFRLNRMEIYDGIVAPELVEATADVNGQCIVNLFPNALGSASSQYEVRAWNAEDGRKIIDALCSVPDSASLLHEIINLEPYPEVDQALQAMVAAQSALSAVTEQRLSAEAAADAALSSANDAAESALAAQTSGSAIALGASIAASTGAAMVGANAYQTQADINADNVSVAARGASVSPSDAKVGIQSTVDSFSSGTVQRGAFRFPPGKDYSISGEVLIHRKTLDIDGQNASIKWEGPNTASMFRVTDSARVSFRNLALIGDLDTPPIAALFFDSPVLGTEGSNENHIVENVVIGRLYTSDTTTGGSADATPYGKVQYGIRIGGAVDGNNDEYTIRNVQVHGASVAAISFDNSQGIWSMLDHVLVNDSTIGVRSGCNLTIRNLHANRNTSADLEGIRNTETNVDTFNTENSILPIWSKAGASFYVWSGKWILSAAAPGNFVRVESGGSLLLDGMTIQFAGASAQTFYYRSSSGKGGKISVKNSTIENGSARDTWDIDTGGGTTALPVAIDIEHGSFKWVQSERSPYLDRAVTPPAVAAAASGLIGSGAAKTPFGTFFNVALSTPLLGQHLTSAYEQAGQIRARLFNVTGSSITLAACRARWMAFEEHITARASANINAPSLANNTGHTATITLPGASLGDFVVCAQGGAYLSSVVTCYVSSTNTVAVRIHNASGGVSDPPDTLFYVGKVAEFGNFHGTAAYTPAAIANGASITVAVSVPGAQVGGHVFATYSADMQGLTHSAEVSAADTVTITVTNYKGAPVTLAAGYFRAMVAF